MSTSHPVSHRPRVRRSYFPPSVLHLKTISFLEMNPTGDAEMDALKRQQLEKELARISRNAELCVAREKRKGKFAASPAAGSAGPSDADSKQGDLNERT
ncbi:hypothetical protein LTR37_015752 [Vermiconidia calcicola]|uniref:Uncharacterized protein n=1 Tax=Vermiconidia calcicola TaxID=1690605 RepID=A0ACC3MR93_9PEZI|nr:hypothetical protein LTR37_015752 [Vermiconidia calcicola]